MLLVPECPVALLPHLHHQPHPPLQVRLNVTVEQPEARVVQLASQDDVAVPGHLDGVLRSVGHIFCVALGTVQNNYFNNLMI